MLFRTRYNVLFRQFRLLTAQAGSIPATIRLIFENCYRSSAGTGLDAPVLLLILEINRNPRRTHTRRRYSFLRAVSACCCSCMARQRGQVLWQPSNAQVQVERQGSMGHHPSFQSRACPKWFDLVGKEVFDDNSSISGPNGRCHHGGVIFV